MSRNKKASPAAREPDPFTMLLFVRDVPKGEPSLPNGARRHFWTVPSTGDSAFDGELGAAFGRRVVSLIRKAEAPPNLLTCTIADIIADGLDSRGHLTGAQIGFLCELQRGIGGSTRL
jgi:hypothetical protein